MITNAHTMIQHMMLLFFARWRATDMLAAISDTLNERQDSAWRAQAARRVDGPKIELASCKALESLVSCICELLQRSDAAPRPLHYV